MKKKSIMLSCFLCLVIILQAQVQIRPLPKRGFEKRIHEAVYAIRLIDTHEHLMSEKQALAGPNDFRCLFENYQGSDMVSSGLAASIMPGPNWEETEPAWEAMKNTGYGRAVLLSAKGLYDIDDLNANTQAELSKRINASHHPGFYKEVLKQKAKIDLCIIMGESEVTRQDTAYFKCLKDVWIITQHKIKEKTKNAPAEFNKLSEQAINVMNKNRDALSKNSRNTEGKAKIEYVLNNIEMYLFDCLNAAGIFGSKWDDEGL